jgi:enamine deaminase RidA (YjgF/YER057c/UK114 family)
MPRAITPKGFAAPLGMYSHGVVAPGGALVVVAGQVGVDTDGRVVGPGDVKAQSRQAYENIQRILAAAGCTMRDVVRFQTFLTHASDIEAFMQARREIFPGYYADGVYPPNTLLVVSRLVRPEYLVEIEAMAVKRAEARRAERRAGAAAGRRVARPSGRRPVSKKRR